jgi:Polyketide cyclase / dehydrase and lipid transport
MITVQRVVPTTLDPQSTFAYLSAFEHTPDWDPGTPVVEKLSTGPVAVGTKYHAVADFRGKRQPIDYVVTELSADRIQLRGENKTVISVDTISVRPSANGSEVTYHAEFTLKGLLKLATPFVGPLFEKLAEPAAQGMKRELDSLAAAPKGS